MIEDSVTTLAPALEPESPDRGGPLPARRSLRELVHERSGSWWAPLLVFVSVGVLVWIAVWFGNNHLGHDAFFPTRPAIGGSWFGGWARWDAEWYRTIVREGYVYYPSPSVQSSVAFWPSYPIVVKAFSWAFPSIYITGTVVTAASGAAAVMLLRRWAGLFVPRAAAITAVVVLCVYPYSWYLYGAVYSDALFIAATIAAFLLVERDRMFWAGIVGIAATAGRPAGLVVAVALVLRMLERRNTANGVEGFLARFNPRGMTRRDAPLLLSWLGVGGWCAFLWAKFGDPFMFATIEASKGWEQGAGPATWLKFRLFEELQHRPFAWSTIGHLVQGLLTIGALFLVPLVKRRFGWAYALYVLGVIGLPLVGTKDFLGAGRYVLAAFPCIVIMGELLAARPRLRSVLVPVSLLVLLGMSVAFGRGSYLA